MKNIHIGIIPDGNRRYAKKMGITKKEAYQLGFKVIKKIIFTLLKDCSPSQNKTIKKYFSKYNINELTIFVCSKDNIQKRSTEDVNNILKMIKKFIKYYKIHRDSIMNMDIKINIIGNINLIKSNDIYNKLSNIVNETADNKQYILNLAIAYDCKSEIIDLIDLIEKNRKNENLNASEDKDKDEINKNLWLKTNIDLVIRTGFEKRTSGFFPLQTIYAEWFFINKFWPEFDVNDVFKIIKKYEKRERRYGK